MKNVWRCSWFRLKQSVAMATGSQAGYRHHGSLWQPKPTFETQCCTKRTTEIRIKKREVVQLAAERCLHDSRWPPLTGALHLLSCDPSTKLWSHGKVVVRVPQVRDSWAGRSLSASTQTWPMMFSIKRKFLNLVSSGRIFQKTFNVSSMTTETKKKGIRRRLPWSRPDHLKISNC